MSSCAWAKKKQKQSCGPEINERHDQDQAITITIALYCPMAFQQYVQGQVKKKSTCKETRVLAVP